MSVRQTGILSIACALALSAAAAVAQEAPVPGQAPATRSAPMIPQDCTKPMVRHDHGAERGTAAPMRSACLMGAATSAKAKAKPGHDHSRFHKLM